MQKPPSPTGLIETARGAETLRVWSVVITVFGDVVAPRGGAVAGAALAELAAPLGIGAGAMRVALHRLVRDGWLDRRRVGRGSVFRLSGRGQAEFGPARRRIYASAPAATDRLCLLLADPALPVAGREAISERLAGAGATPVAPGVWLARPELPPPEGVFALTGTAGAVPAWLRARLGPPAVAEAYRRLAADLDALATALAGAAVPAPAEAAAVRILVVHRWRRCLLRHPDLPAAFLPDDWPGEAVRARVLDLYARLSRPADPWLDRLLAAPGRVQPEWPPAPDPVPAPARVSK